MQASRSAVSRTVQHPQSGPVGWRPRLDWKRAWTLLGLALATTAAAATFTASSDRKYLVHVWRSEDGLPQNSVNCLAQTPDDYLWVGTRSGGLARFDGLRFVHFNPNTTPQLQDVEFETLSVDSQGTLWITAGNESVARVTRGQFHLVRERNAIPRWHPLHLVGEDREAVYLAAYEPAIFRVPRQGTVNAVQRIPLQPPPPLPFPAEVIQAGDGSLWYVTIRGSVGQVTVRPDGTHSQTNIDLGQPVQCLARDAAGQIWVAMSNRLGVLREHSFSDRTPAENPFARPIRRLVPTRQDGVWAWDGESLRRWRDGRWEAWARDFAPRSGAEEPRFFADSRDGLWVINYGFGLWHIEPDGAANVLTPRDGLPGVFITSWREDAEGNIWIGTREGGLARIRRARFHLYGSADGIPGEVAQSVCEDAQGVLWVGTATGGIARQEGERFVSVTLPALPGRTLESISVYPDRVEGIWIGTVKGSVLRYSQGQVTRPFPAQWLRDLMADVVMQDSSGRVWFANGSGAYYWADNQFTTFGRKFGFVEDLGIRALAEGPPGTIWFGTEPGDVWELRAGLLTRHQPPADWPNARVSALLPDVGGIWVGTLGNGLVWLAEGRFVRLTVAQGLPDNNVTQLLADENGHLWGGTYAGLFRTRKADLHAVLTGQKERLSCSIFGFFDGLPSQAYSGWYQPACWRTKDGRLWFTTVKGLAAVNPRVIEPNPRPPSIHIEEVRVDGATVELPVPEGSSGRAAPLTIPPGRHYLEFRFTGISLTAPDRVRCRWRLLGAEGGWRESLNQRVVAYGPLPAGQYTFQVQAANSDGIWNENGASLAVTILPHFWETSWFRGLAGGGMLAALAGSIVGIMHRRHRRQMERLQRLRELDQERARIARDLHDDLGTTLTQINFLCGLISLENTSPAEIDRLSRQIRATAREMLNRLNEIVWAVNPKNDTLAELLGYLSNFATRFCRDAGMRCRLRFAADLPDCPIKADVRHNLFLAFKEAVHNAVRHSRASDLVISAALQNTSLVLAIEDNGRGLDPASAPAGSGQGLTNMRQRLTLIGGECRIFSRPDGGTTVEFRLGLREMAVSSESTIFSWLRPR